MLPRRCCDILPLPTCSNNDFQWDNDHDDDDECYYLNDLIAKPKTTVSLGEAALVDVIDEDLRAAVAVLSLVAEGEAEQFLGAASGQHDLLTGGDNYSNIIKK